MNLQATLDSLRQLAENPSSNIVAASLGLAVVVVVVLVLVMIVLIVIVPGASRRPAAETRDENEQARDDDTASDIAVPLPEPGPRHGSRMLARGPRTWLLMAIVIIATAAMYRTTGTNEYCSSTCHVMLDAGGPGTSSLHATTRCIHCHEGSFVDASMTRTRHLVAQLRDPTDLVSRAAVSSQRCLRCHRDIVEGTITSGRGISVRHSDIIAAGGDCLRCHPSVGHGSGPATRIGTMRDCLRCHDGEQALAACFICHEGDPAQAAVATRVFGKTKLPPPRCEDCHTPPIPR